MKKIKTALLAGTAVSLIFFGAGCNPFAGDVPSAKSEPTVEQPASDNTDYGDAQMAEDTALSNPATVYCLSRGGEFIMEKTLAGATEGLCRLKDGTECEVWAMYKGECADLNESDNTIEDDSSTSTESIAEIDDNATSTSAEKPAIDEDDADNSESSEDPAGTITDGEKKKAVGDIDIAVKPGEETGEIIMSWDTHDLKAPDGYYAMLSTSDNITYPTKFAHDLSREESYSFTWVDLNPEKEYFFRVCIKSGDSCGTYSPIISTYPRANETE